MSALHSAVDEIYAKEDKIGEDPLVYNPARLSESIDAAFDNIPILTDITNGTSPAAYRREGKERGGCVLLRGVGIAVLTQAYKYAVETNMPFKTVTKKLGGLDWYAIKADAPPQGETEDAATYVNRAAQPI